jgi:hypothetical protein
MRKKVATTTPAIHIARNWAQLPCGISQKAAQTKQRAIEEKRILI